MPNLILKNNRVENTSQQTLDSFLEKTAVRIQAASLCNDRSNNEDAFFVVQKANCLIIGVLDGLGGHANGELASNDMKDALVKVLEEIIINETTSLEDMAFEAFLRARNACDWMTDNRDTTCLIGVIVEGKASVINIGDCNLTLICPGTEEPFRLLNAYSKTHQVWNTVSTFENFAHRASFDLPSTSWHLLFFSDGFETIKPEDLVELVEQHTAEELCSISKDRASGNYADNSTLVIVSANL